jgi:NAD-dependent SIR2 family protein deacetylase
MIFGSKQFKNGKVVGYLEFNSGKKVFLNQDERFEFLDKVEYWKFAERLDFQSEKDNEKAKLLEQVKRIDAITNNINKIKEIEKKSGVDNELVYEIHLELEKLALDIENY